MMLVGSESAGAPSSQKNQTPAVPVTAVTSSTVPSQQDLPLNRSMEDTRSRSMEDTRSSSVDTIVPKGSSAKQIEDSQVRDVSTPSSTVQTVTTPRAADTTLQTVTTPTANIKTVTTATAKDNTILITPKAVDSTLPSRDTLKVTDQTKSKKSSALATGKPNEGGTRKKSLSKRHSSKKSESSKNGVRTEEAKTIANEKDSTESTKPTDTVNGHKDSSDSSKAKSSSTPSLDLTRPAPTVSEISPTNDDTTRITYATTPVITTSTITPIVLISPPGSQAAKTNVQTAELPKSSTASPVKKPDSSVPMFNFPAVQPIEKGTTLRMLRNRPRGPPRNAQRMANTSNNVQNVLQQMVGGGAQRSGVPCGHCDCCKSLLTYVTVLRNFMDHIVSGMSQGNAAIEENIPPPPPCTLCEVQHVPHVDHSPKPSSPGTAVGDSIGTGSGNQNNAQNAPAQTHWSGQGHKEGHTPTHGNQSDQGHYTPSPTQHFPHHSPGGWQHQGQNSNQQFHNQTTHSQQSGGHGSNQQQQGSYQQNQQQGSYQQNQQQGSYQQNQQQGSYQQNQQQGSYQQNQQQGPHQQNQQPGQQISGQPGTGSTTPVNVHNQQAIAPTSGNSWSTFTDPNAPKPQSSSQANSTPRQVEGSTGNKRPKRVMENIAWGGNQQPNGQQTTDLSAEVPLTDLPTEHYTSGSPTRQHVEEYDEAYADEYEEDEYEIELNEAFVTMATDNQSALLCMVLGNSLILSGTTKSLVVLVTEDVSPHMRYLLSTIYNNVQSIDMMDSPGITSLSLLEQPDLGVSFTKLLIWGIEQYDKGVFLDPNTLVVQNCDELFDREELSAVPDIGWPDCFNSDVFVFKPSMETFWSLLNCAEGDDNFDGGDQGLLNTYFRDWSRNISKKLPFLYNLMANVSYTYKPAFKQFGSQVKIVNFFGSYKPLNVQFHSATGQMAPDSNVHPTYAQFVYYWLEIFTKRVLPLFSQEIHDFIDNQEFSSAMDVLKFFPSNARKRKESLPTPPSFRVYADANIDRPRRKSALGVTEEEDKSEEAGLVSHDQVPSTDDVAIAVEVPAVPLTMPGSEMGNFQDMSAWEHGRMDYLGTHKSDTIMARLDYLMRNPAEREN